LRIFNRRRIVAGFKLLFELHPPQRNVEVFPDDIFIVSYPKSGNTWTRFLIANLVYPDTPANFININDLTPDPEALSKRRMARMPRPRIIKSHQYFDPRYPRIINIVRDPRDVALSQFHFHRKRRLIADDYPLQEWVKSFLSSDFTVYGSWGDNVGSWLATRYGRPGFLLLRYEDMISHPERELTRVASFLDINRDPKSISEAVRRSSADNMRQLEKTQSLSWGGTRETRQDIPFIRSAKSGGWRSDLPAASVAMIETAWGPWMRWLGYELSSGSNRSQSDFEFPESVLGIPAG